MQQNVFLINWYIFNWKSIIKKITSGWLKRWGGNVNFIINRATRHRRSRQLRGQVGAQWREMVRTFACNWWGFVCSPIRQTWSPLGGSVSVSEDVKKDVAYWGSAVLRCGSGTECVLAQSLMAKRNLAEAPHSSGEFGRNQTQSQYSKLMQTRRFPLHSNTCWLFSVEGNTRRCVFGW